MAEQKQIIANSQQNIGNGASDLGIGELVAAENRTRFINPDGSFNVSRRGVDKHGAFSPYHAILSYTWPRFFAFVLSAYLFVNLIFTGLYFFTGPTGLSDVTALNPIARFGELFFFSVQIITTIAASSPVPLSVAAKILVSAEAFVGLSGFALITGLTFARFSNPAVRIIFSENAVIAPYRGITGFMIRIVNGRNNEFIQVRAALTVAMYDHEGKRVFSPLPIERSEVLVFPLSWTIVHPITKDSPLYGLTNDDLLKRAAEFVIAISATDQDLAREVYVRRSYVANEIAVGSRFTNILEQTPNGTVFIDPKRIHEIETVG